MSDSIEILVTSETSARFWSACVWDVNTGNVLHIYKNAGVITPNTLKFINNDYVISAECLKPLLHVWPVNSQEISKNIRLVCPGRVTALDVSLDGYYCAAGIGEKLYIWHISTGKLLSIASKHFQTINKVLFTSDGSYVVSCADDGLVLIWSLAQLISKHSLVHVQSEQIDPVHTISDHSLGVRDMYIGKGGHHARLVTISADRTMKIYQLVSKNLLLSVVFDVGLNAVCMNLSETYIYVGTIHGNIFEICLLNPPRTREYHMQTKENTSFKGHTKAITTLAVSLDGQTLASGSLDEEVIIWHIQTKQKIRSLSHKGSINNLFFIIAPKNMFAQDLKPTTVINNFSKTISENEDVVEVINVVDQELPFDNALVSDNNFKTDVEDEVLDRENKRLRIINTKLYRFALLKIMEEPKVVYMPESAEKVPKRKRKCKEN